MSADGRDPRVLAIDAGGTVTESPADTFAIPPRRSARLDRHRIFHLGS